MDAALLEALGKVGLVAGIASIIVALLKTYTERTANAIAEKRLLIEEDEQQRKEWQGQRDEERKRRDELEARARALQERADKVQEANDRLRLERDAAQAELLRRQAACVRYNSPCGWVALPDPMKETVGIKRDEAKAAITLEVLP